LEQRRVRADQSSRLARANATEREARVLTKSSRRQISSACALDSRTATMVAMDVVAVLLGIVAFAVLYALIFGIDRI
jgi:hypothetical protein